MTNTMTKSGSRSASGYTLVEILIVISIIALLGAMVVPNLLGGRRIAIEGTGQELKTQLTDTYNKWTHAGGQHSTTGGKALTELLITTLAGAPSNAGVNSTSGTATVDETVYMVGAYSVAGAIRTTLPAPLVIEAGATGRIIYNKMFAIDFTPTTERSGTWTVTVSDTKYQ